METIFDLPAHPLLVHAPLVLMPLLALVTLALAVRPSWRVRYGPLALGASVVLLVATFLATRSGEAFEEVLEGAVNVDRHAALGRTARTFAILLTVSLAVQVVLARWLPRRAPSAAAGSVPTDGAARRGSGRVVLVDHACAVLSLVFAVLGTVWMLRTGHEGARLVWGE